MKKYFLLFAAGGLLTLASCGGDTAPQATLNTDSIKAVIADSTAKALKAQSDSTLAATAQSQVDSMAQVMKTDSIVAATKEADAKAAASAAKASAKKAVSTHKSTPVKEVTPPVTPVNPKEARFNKDVKEQEQQKSTDKKAERFNK